VGAEEDAWSSIGKAVLLAAGVEDGGPEDFKSTYLEVIRQALSGIAQALGGLIGADVRCSGAAGIGEAPAAGSVPTRIVLADGIVAHVAVAFSAGLIEIGPDGKRNAVTAVAGAGTVQHLEEPDTHRTMDLLYEVELPVSVSFGRARLPLKEVLKLTSGSIVELNRTVSEPVEVIVNNCVIARGEVVVVDGNYGIRVTQILSRRDRLRTLY
jgi:flagellar motor switch protein FliN